jgi:DNA polymerase-3 subunit alpha
VPIAVAAADQAEAGRHQGGLFEEANGAREVIEMPRVEPWGERDKLLEEKQALGFCFSGHLFTPYSAEVRRFVSSPLNRLNPGRDSVWVAGVVSASRAQMTRRGMMRIVEIDDSTAKLEITVFSELWDQFRHLIKVDEPLIIQARIENDDFSGGLRGAASDILTLGQARMKFSLGIRLRLAKMQQPKDHTGRRPNEDGSLAGKLKSILEPWKAPAQGCPIFIRMQQGEAECDIQLPGDLRVRPEEELIRALAEHFTHEGVEVLYR